MKITPLAFESMGVRSMATFIETDHKILIDPGTSLGAKRFGLPPLKTEFNALHETRATHLCREIPKVVVDHHLLRDLHCFDFIKSVQDETENKLMVASELVGKEPNLLEARRKEFYLEK